MSFTSLFHILYGGPPEIFRELFEYCVYFKCYFTLIIQFQACLHPVMIETDNIDDVVSLADSATASTDSEIEIDATTAENRNLKPLHYYSHKATLGLPYKILPIPDATNVSLPYNTQNFISG